MKIIKRYLENNNTWNFKFGNFVLIDKVNLFLVAKVEFCIEMRISGFCLVKISSDQRQLPEEKEGLKLDTHPSLWQHVRRKRGHKYVHRNQKMGMKGVCFKTCHIQYQWRASIRRIYPSFLIINICRILFPNVCIMSNDACLFFLGKKTFRVLFRLHCLLPSPLDW